eukprot:2025599-Prymnesium_polylepis.1
MLRPNSPPVPKDDKRGSADDQIAPLQNKSASGSRSRAQTTAEPSVPGMTGMVRRTSLFYDAMQQVRIPAAFGNFLWPLSRVALARRQCTPRAARARPAGRPTPVTPARWPPTPHLRARPLQMEAAEREQSEMTDTTRLASDRLAFKREGRDRSSANACPRRSMLTSDRGSCTSGKLAGSPRGSTGSDHAELSEPSMAAREGARRARDRD